ncbi:hypothetical protein A2W24_00990 [Microgenomates group bacterium RBG_16_45_19]|nr:MAG: hypothetical protein A2W24_00990 [Microgenomates group bacterium RBG_16_45_19]
MMGQLNFRRVLKPKKTDQYFQTLVSAIIGQQLSGKAADTIEARVLELMKEKNFSPRKVLEADEQQLRQAGMSWAKITYVKNIASAFKSGKIEAEELTQLEDEAVIQTLTQIKGVGRWTAEMFLIFTLGREDVYSSGDLGLNKALRKIYQLESPTLKEIDGIIEPWSPYKSYGSLALWESLDNRP